MTEINEYKAGWRKVFLVLLLVALSGPWYFDRVSVPSPHACSSGIRLDEDFCGLPGSGLWIVPFAFGGVFNVARELIASSGDTSWLMVLPGFLPLLILLPFFSLLLAMWRPQNRRGQIFSYDHFGGGSGEYRAISEPALLFQAALGFMGTLVLPVPGAQYAAVGVVGILGRRRSSAR